MKMANCFLFLGLLIFCPLVFSKDGSTNTKTVPYFVYSPVMSDKNPQSHGGDLFVNTQQNLLTPKIDRMDNKAIAKAIQEARDAICGTSENVDAKVWFSLGAHGEVGIGAKVGADIQSGFEVTFHCGQIKKVKS